MLAERHVVFFFCSCSLDCNISYHPPRRKIIAPTISLNSGKIVYDYYLDLDDSNTLRTTTRKVNSSIRAHVDPTKGITLKWTDGIKGGGGVSEGSCWVSECRIPLGTTGSGPLAADVRIGRRWVIG